MIGLIGGTGPEGRGLALRMALAGYDVFIGSREVMRAQDAAKRVARRVSGVPVLGGLNEEAAVRSDTAFVTVPYAAQCSVLRPLADALVGKVVVSTVVPLRFDENGAGYLPPEAGSAAMEAQETLPGSRVVAAFQTISAHDLLDPNRRIESDVVVCSDDDEAKAEVSALAREVQGIRAIDGGGLRNAVFVEHITPLLLNINKVYGGRSAVRFTGLER